MRNSQGTRNEDAELVREIEGCSGDAFKRLYAKYSSRVRQFVDYRISNRADTEDIRQEIWLDVYKACKEKKVKNPERIGILILKISKNKIIDVIRKNYSKAGGPDKASDIGKILFVSIDILRSIIGHDLSVLDDILDLERCLNKLKPEIKDLLLKHYVLGFSWKELAKQNSKTEKALKMRASRAMKKLRECMEVSES